MSERFVVEGLGGAKTLTGSVRVCGAKNAALKGLASSVLFDGDVEFKNLPEIEDVKRMQELLATKNGRMDTSIAAKLRASVVLTGPLLARYGEVSFPQPGGDVIGDRPINLFLDGYRAMGATVEKKDDLYVVRGKLAGATIYFPFISVTATETLMMAATLAEGETVLQNAAMEPEVADLAHFLAECGAKIEGAGTPTINIKGGRLLKPNVAYETPPDRIEAGSFILFAALAGNKVTVENCKPEELGALFSLLTRAGAEYQIDGTSVHVHGVHNYKSTSARTHEYPGFPTDLQAPYAVFLTQCTGEATILETIFDGRFRYVDELVRMGAKITVMNPHKILVKGPTKLSGKELESPDIRAGLAYLLAATVAEGTSIINNAYMIDRGYYAIEERLKNLGLNIMRESI